MRRLLFAYVISSILLFVALLIFTAGLYIDWLLLEWLLRVVSSL